MLEVVEATIDAGLSATMLDFLVLEEGAVLEGFADVDERIVDFLEPKARDTTGSVAVLMSSSFMVSISSHPSASAEAEEAITEETEADGFDDLRADELTKEKADDVVSDAEEEELEKEDVAGDEDEVVETEADERVVGEERETVDDLVGKESSRSGQSSSRPSTETSAANKDFFALEAGTGATTDLGFVLIEDAAVDENDGDEAEVEVEEVEDL